MLIKHYFSVDPEAIYQFLVKNDQDRDHQATRQRINIVKDRKNTDLEVDQLVEIIRKAIKGKATQGQEVILLIANLGKGWYNHVKRNV